MRNILPVILALLLCCIGAICNGQQITQQTTVTVLNENGSPAVNAIAFRLSKTDLAIRQTVMADSAGRIVFPGNVDFGKEFVKITAFGYKDIDITDGSPSEPLKVVFAPLSVRLDEFVVSVEQNTVQKSDRLVFNIAGTNLAKGNNIYEVLKFAPLVKEENRQLSIIGKESTLLYINGRKTNVPAESMNAYLRGIPAENIAKIEVITNPGATLRNSGNTGIINIELKKNENDGVKGSLYVEDVQRKNNSQYGSLYLDMQKKNLNVTAGLYVNHSIQDAVNDTDYDYFNSGDKERLHENNNTRSLMTGGNVRADYRINPNHTIGMGFDAFHTEGKNRTLSDIYYGKLNSPSIDSVYYSDNRTDAPVSRYAVNLNYRGKISENDWLTIDLDYLRNDRDNTVFNIPAQCGGTDFAVEIRTVGNRCFEQLFRQNRIQTRFQCQAQPDGRIRRHPHRFRIGFLPYFRRRRSIYSRHGEKQFLLLSRDLYCGIPLLRLANQRQVVGKSRCPSRKCRRPRQPKSDRRQNYQTRPESYSFPIRHVRSECEPLVVL